MKKLKSTIALVTGSSRGLGAAIAVELGRQGATLILHASRRTQDTEASFSQIQTISSGSCIYYADITKSDEVSHMTQAIQKQYGRVDILINNAGITKAHTMLAMTDDEWDTVIKTNLTGVFYVCRSVVPLMKQNSRIINMASIYGLVGEYGLTNYCASKAGVIGFTKALAKELAPKGITVNAVCPGLTDTGMISAVPEKELSLRLAQIPIGRIGKKDEIAKLVAFLASPDASYITGQAISINGGMV